MENRSATTITRQPIVNPLAGFDRDSNELTRKRLNALLAANAEIAREKAMYSSEKERFEAELIKTPLNSEKAFSLFGLMLGAFPPAAIFAKILLNNGSFRPDEMWLLGVMAVVNLISAVVGFFSGKLIGKIVRETEKMEWWNMLLLLPFVGALWGIMSGGAGGVIIFIIGAVFGAGLGALVGAAALPLFTIFHRLLKKGDLIERNQFLPIAFGITFAICGFILGL